MPRPGLAPDRPPRLAARLATLLRHRLPLRGHLGLLLRLRPRLHSCLSHFLALSLSNVRISSNFRTLSNSTRFVYRLFRFQRLIYDLSIFCVATNTQFSLFIRHLRRLLQSSIEYRRVGNSNVATLFCVAFGSPPRGRRLSPFLLRAIAWSFADVLVPSLYASAFAAAQGKGMLVERDFRIRLGSSAKIVLRLPGPRHDARCAGAHLH